MLPAQFVLILLILAAPIYAVLHALSFALPLYLLLLSLGLGLLYLCWRPETNFEEVFWLSAGFVGICCTIAGLAIAPLLVQVIAAIGLLTVYKRYQVEI